MLLVNGSMQDPYDAEVLLDVGRTSHKTDEARGSNARAGLSWIDKQRHSSNAVRLRLEWRVACDGALE